MCGKQKQEARLKLLCFHRLKPPHRRWCRQNARRRPHGCQFLASFFFCSNSFALWIISANSIAYISAFAPSSCLLLHHEDSRKRAIGRDKRRSASRWHSTHEPHSDISWQPSHPIDCLSGCTNVLFLSVCAPSSLTPYPPLLCPQLATRVRLFLVDVSASRVAQNRCVGLCLIRSIHVSLLCVRLVCVGLLSPRLRGVSCWFF